MEVEDGCREAEVGVDAANSSTGSVPLGREMRPGPAVARCTWWPPPPASSSSSNSDLRSGTDHSTAKPASSSSLAQSPAVAEAEAPDADES